MLIRLARRRRWLPSTWRIWPWGFVIAVLFACPAALAGLLLLGSVLTLVPLETLAGRHAPRLPTWIRRSSKVLIFVAGGILAVTSLFAGLHLALLLLPPSYRLQGIMGLFFLVAIAVGWRMVHGWWRGGVATILGVGMVASFVVNFLWAVEEPDLMPTFDGISTLLRILLVLGLGMLWAPHVHHRSWTPATLWLTIGQSIAMLLFAFLLSGIAQSTSWDTDFGWSIWVFLVVLGAGVVMAVLQLARLTILQEWRSQFWRTGRLRPRASARWFAAIALLPALATVSIVDWAAWWIILALGLVSEGLYRLALIPRRLPTTPKPVEPVPAGT